MLFIIYLVKLHHFLASHLLGLVQGRELDLIRRQGLIGEGTLDGVQVMGTDGDKGTLSSKVLVQLVLESDEGFVAGLCEVDIPEDGAREVGSDL